MLTLKRGGEYQKRITLTKNKRSLKGRTMDLSPCLEEAQSVLLSRSEVQEAA
jgi:hypothetical protein